MLQDGEGLTAETGISGGVNLGFTAEPSGGSAKQKGKGGCPLDNPKGAITQLTVPSVPKGMNRGISASHLSQQNSIRHVKYGWILYLLFVTYFPFFVWVRVGHLKHLLPHRKKRYVNGEITSLCPVSHWVRKAHDWNIDINTNKLKYKYIFYNFRY